MATCTGLFAVLLFSLFSLICGQICTPGLPIVKNPRNGLKKPIKLYLTEGTKGAKRYPINQDYDIPNFGFYQALKVQAPKAEPLVVMLSGSQLFNGFGGALSYRPKNNDSDRAVYYAADSTSISQLVHAVDICNAAGEMKTVLAPVTLAGNLIYRPFQVSGPVKPGVTILRPGSGAALPHVDIEIEM